MITTYAQIGKLRMRLDSLSQMSSADQKMYIIRQFCAEDSAFTYKEKKNEGKTATGRIVRMQLDTSDDSIRFSAGEQIGTGTCAKRLIFKNYAPADPNIYASHTGYKSIMAFTLMEYIITNRAKIQWSKPEEVDACIDYLRMIREKFFVEDSKGLRPNYLLLSEDQRSGFPDPQTCEDLFCIEDPAKFKKAKDKAAKSYFEKELKDITGDRQAYALTIDGRFFHEIPQLAACYLDVLYYYIIDKQFADSGNQGYCHLCSLQSSLAKDVFLKQKFYGVKNPYFFDNASASMSRNSFSVCKDCYNQITVGTQISSTEFKTYLLGLDCLILPELDLAPEPGEAVINPQNLKAITTLLRRRNTLEHKAQLGIVRDLQYRLRDFTLFFYSKPSPTSQEFIVNRLIKGISLPSLIHKSDDLSRISDENRLSEILNQDFSMSFEGLRFLLLPSKESHPSLKPLEYQKINRDMLSLLSAYLYSQKMDLSLIIKRFVDIFSRKFNNLKDHSSYYLDLSPYIMNLYIEHLRNFNQIRSQKYMEERPMTTTLEHEELLAYFNNHQDVYADNHAAQGLFILGWYLADLEYEQKKKGTNRTAIHKLNLRGIPLQKVKSIMATIDDLRQVWKVYQDGVLDAYYRECLSSIEASGISPEEVVYHILSGRAYKSYVAITKYKDKQNEKANQEAQND